MQKIYCSVVGFAYNDLKRFDIPSLPPILIDRCAIPYSTYVKNLGVFIDSTFSWDMHIKNVSKVDLKCELSMKLQRVQNACVRYACNLKNLI
ncbi:hypothetical protein B566_EDAN011536, partial [Ephemera danica]